MCTTDQTIWFTLELKLFVAVLQVQRDFEELPANAAEALQASLLNLLIRFATGAMAVRTQLCLAMAAMAAHIPSKQWSQGGIVEWLAENLRQQAQDVALPCMLELLTVIPEASFAASQRHLAPCLHPSCS